MNNWTVRARIVAAFATIILIMAALPAVSLIQLRDIRTQAKLMREDVTTRALTDLIRNYHRVPGQASRSVGGTGFGLLIAKEIVEGHGGSISVSSSGVVGEGTTFVMALPLVVSPRDSALP